MLNLTENECSWSIGYLAASFNNKYVLVESTEIIEPEDVDMFEEDEIIHINNVPHSVMHHIIFLDEDHILQFHTPTTQVSHTEMYYPKFVTPEIHQQVLSYFNF